MINAHRPSGPLEWLRTLRRAGARLRRDRLPFGQVMLLSLLFRSARVRPARFPAAARASEEEQGVLARPGSSSSSRLAEDGGSDAGGVPIVFVHRSNSSYLQYSLQQARLSNPASTIHLIGDDENEGYPGIQHHSMEKYLGDAETFEGLYRHMSTNGYEIELFCFQRWFILRDFVRRSELETFVYLDSDVMLFSDVTTDMPRFGVFDLALVQRFVPCTLFVMRAQALDDFCEFVLDVYRGLRRYEWDSVVARHALAKRNGVPGGVSDMTLFELFHAENFGRIGELAQVLDDSIYDNEISCPHLGFEMDGEVKRLTWRDGKPYGKHLRTGRHIRFKSLHCQGKNKQLMRTLFHAAVSGDPSALR